MRAHIKLLFTSEQDNSKLVSDGITIEFYKPANRYCKAVLLQSLAPLALIFLSIHCQSQSVNTTMSGRSLGLANVTAALPDEWSILNNIGGLSKTKAANAAVAYEVKPALLGGNRMAAAFSMPVKTGAFGFGLFRFGDNFYNEQLATLGFGNEFGNTSLGVKVNYIQYQAIGFGNKTALGISFGGLTQLSKGVSIGAYVVNLNQPAISLKDKEKLPAQLVMGVGVKPKEVLQLFIEISKELDYSPTIKAAMEYEVHKKIYARTGFNLQPEAAFFGVGFIYPKLKMDYAFQYTQNLNYAFQMSITYQLGNLITKSNG